MFACSSQPLHAQVRDVARWVLFTVTVTWFKFFHETCLEWFLLTFPFLFFWFVFCRLVVFKWMSTLTQSAAAPVRPEFPGNSRHAAAGQRVGCLVRRSVLCSSDHHEDLLFIRNFSLFFKRVAENKFERKRSLKSGCTSFSTEIE